MPLNLLPIERNMDVSQVRVDLVERAQEARYQALMAREHYLGALS